jgi:hypothetical protein
MDYSRILNELNGASLFELYRLDVAIRQQLDDPKRLRLVKAGLKTGLLIKYFDANENRLIDAKILELKRTKVLVENSHDGELWNIPYYFINIDDVDTTIPPSSNQKLSRNNLKVGDKVCFKDKKGRELFGEVIKLNQKTAGVLVGQVKWRVAYSLLSLIIDGELGADNRLLEGEVLSRE